MLVEQHVDGCGEDLSQIVDLKLLHYSELMDAFSETETESDEEPNLESYEVNVSLVASLLGSDAVPEGWA